MKRKADLMKGLPEIGKIVRGIMKEQRLTHRKLGKMLGWNTTTITLMLTKVIWTNAELVLVGRALNTDLLKYYYPVPPQPMVPATELEAAHQQVQHLQTELMLKDAELLKLRTENAVLREVFGGMAKQGSI